MYTSVVYERGTWKAVACEHISYVGTSERWVRLPSAVGPVERLCAWNAVRLCWELG